MEIRLIRHATLLVDINGIKLLVDPMLSDKYEMEPVANAENKIRIPMTDFPFGNRELMNILNSINGIIVTHLHRDHFDARAKKLLKKTLPVFCQPEDYESIKNSGFKNVFPINENFEWNGITILRTKGKHGKGEIGKQMGKVSGFVLKYIGQPTLYIAGDTIWCDDVETAIRKNYPRVIVVNSGAAQFISGDPITMDKEDVESVCKAASNSKIVAVHFETINHCLLKRQELKDYLNKKDLSKNAFVPEDGETLIFK